MPQRGTNTMAEALSTIVSTLAQAMEFPDADIQWLQTKQMEFIDKLREVNPAIPGETGQQPQPGIADLMGPGGGMGGAPVSMAAGMPGGMGGGPGAGSLPPSNLGAAAGARPPINADDFARIMAAR